MQVVGLGSSRPACCTPRAHGPAPGPVRRAAGECGRGVPAHAACVPQPFFTRTRGCARPGPPLTLHLRTKPGKACPAGESLLSQDPGVGGVVVTHPPRVTGGLSGLAEPELEGQVVTEPASPWTQRALVLFPRGPHPKRANRSNENCTSQALAPFQSVLKTLCKIPVSPFKSLCVGISSSLLFERGIDALRV